MKNLTYLKKIRFCIFSIASAFFFFAGCSQNLPDIHNTNYSVVFDYNDNESAPNVRFSVFVQNGTDIRRCERIKIHSEQANYTWETNKLKLISAGEYKWAGNVNFNVPEGEKIPQGRYDITYINADYEEDKTVINLNYDEKFYDVTADKVPEMMKTSGSENIAIFDISNVLLYFGEKTEELSTKGDIFNTFPEASYFNDVWLSYDKSVICVLPENKL